MIRLQITALGTFLRGPNWNFFGPFEHWNPYKNLPLGNKNLSEIFWRDWMGKSVDTLPWYQREFPGIVLVLAYLAVLPPLLAMTILRPFFIKMGFIRFFLLVTLIQFMASLPIKMVLTGSYHQFGEFVSGIAGLPRIVTLHDIDIKPTGTGSYDDLTLTLTAKTYRYLDQDEMAAASHGNTKFARPPGH